MAWGEISLQHTRKFVAQSDCPETPPPRIHSAQDFIDGPNEKAAFGRNFQRNAQAAWWMPGPGQDARCDHDPQSEVGRLSDRDGARLAISEKPLQKRA